MPDRDITAPTDKSQPRHITASVTPKAIIMLMEDDRKMFIMLAVQWIERTKSENFLKKSCIFVKNQK